mmetsp:Transcript_22522/g.64830  ORF Transcript_22522/g.64830 Transcript_22522/m.64830 type:complete len:508 (+) Transcript_22522:57-1580(+)
MAPMLPSLRRSLSGASLTQKRKAPEPSPTSIAAPSERKVRRKCHLAPVNPESLGVDSRVLREYEAAMRVMVRKGFIPGCASVVLRSGKVVHTMTYGHADLEAKKPFTLHSLCRLICMTKSYIATAFMTLVDEGLADLEDRLDKYLPSFANAKVLPEGATKPVKPKEPIKLKHIISHTSGIGYPPDAGEAPEGEVYTAYAALQKSVQKGGVATLREFIDRLSKIPLLCHPGETYEYGFSMDVLGRVCEVILGKDLEQCLQDRIFNPLGMTSTHWHVHDHDLDRLAACYAGPETWGNLYGHVDGEAPSTPRNGLCRIDGQHAHGSNWRAGQHCRVKSGGGFMGYTHGGLVSTVADTVAFVQMLMNRGVAPDGTRLLKEKTLAIMERNRLKPSWGKGSACYLGNIGVFREGGKEFGMGGAACTYWSVDRADDVACIWFTQHVDMPEFGDIEGVDAKRADLWQAVYDAVRSKAAKKRAAIQRHAGAKHHPLHVLKQRKGGTRAAGKSTAQR